jgi:hypothetical protein
MDDSQVVNHENILEIVRRWSPGRRFALAQDILATLATELEKSTPSTSTSEERPSTLQKALGLLSTGDSPAPSDDDIQRWLDEYRLEKYG